MSKLMGLFIQFVARPGENRHRVEKIKSAPLILKCALYKYLSRGLTLRRHEGQPACEKWAFTCVTGVKKSPLIPVDLNAFQELTNSRTCHPDDYGIQQVIPFRETLIQYSDILGDSNPHIKWVIYALFGSTHSQYTLSLRARFCKDLLVISLEQVIIRLGQTLGFYHAICLDFEKFKGQKCCNRCSIQLCIF